MKIAMITTSGRDLLRHWHVTEPGLGPAVEALLQGFVNASGHEIHVLMPVRRNIQPLRRTGSVFYHEVPTPMWGLRKSLYWGVVRATRNYLREKIQPDVVHGQGTERECGLCAVFSGRPNVITIHGNMAELARLFRSRPFSVDWLAARLENLTLPRTAGVFCNSEYTEGLVKPRTPKTWRVPNAVREEFFAPARRSRATGRCVALNIGVVIPRKRQLELLTVARALHERGCPFELHFIGSADPGDEYAKRFLAEIRAAEAHGYARYLGLKNTAQLIDCLDEAHGMIHFPSEEAFGLVVVEALARGVKFFGARVGGIVDLAGGSPGSELLGTQDFAGLTEAVARWVAQGFGAVPGSSESIRERFHPGVVAARHLEIYQEILSTAR